MHNIYEEAVKILPPEDIDHHESDLYIRVSAESKKLIAAYDFRNNVETFVSNIPPHVLWFDVPFAFTPYWEAKDKSKIY